jgi:hypothetical protein
VIGLSMWCSRAALSQEFFNPTFRNFEFECDIPPQLWRMNYAVFYVHVTKASPVPFEP